MGSFEATLLRGIGVLAVALIVSACGGGDSHRNVIPTDAGDAGKTSPHLDGGSGHYQYAGSTGASGGTIMKGGGYILFGVTGEIPGTSGLTKSPSYHMVGGVVGHASY